MQAQLPAPVQTDQLFRGLSNHSILAASGHRDLLPGDATYLRDEAGRLERLVLDKLSVLIEQQLAAGRSGVVVVSPLAEGADCVVAWAALRLQAQGKPVRVRIVLPYNLGTYLGEQDLDHQTLIRQFIEQAGGYAALRTDAPDAIDPDNTTHRAYTNQAYVEYCGWLIHHTDAAIVLWDGVDTVKPGGTSDFVRMGILGEDSTGRPVRPFPARLHVVHHLITPRQHNPFPLARYFGNATRKVFQPGVTYQWYDLLPKVITSPPNPAGAWYEREGFTKIVVPIILSVGRLLFGVIGFELYRANCPNVGSDWLDSLLKTLNLATLGDITVEGCPPATPIPFTLQLSRLFGGALWLYAIVQVYLAVFQNAWQWVKVFFRRNSYAIVIGLTSQTYALLRDLRTRYRALTVIDPAGNSTHTTAVRLLGVNVVSGDPADESLLRRAYFAHAQRVFVMTGTDDLNVRTAQQMEQLIPSQQNQTGQKRAWHVEVQESRKRYLLSQTTQQQDRLHPFSLVDTMVRRLQVRYPIDRFYQTPGSNFADVVIIGFGPVAEAIVRNTLQLGYFADGRRVRIHVFTPNHNPCAADFLGRHPYLVPTTVVTSYQDRLRNLLFPKGVLTFNELPSSETALLDSAFSLYKLFDPPADSLNIQCLLTMYVCLENPVQAITLLSELLPRLDHYRYRDRLHHRAPMTDLQVFCHYDLPDEQEVDFMEKRLNDRATYVPVVFFGKFADECTLDVITARQEDRLAKQVALWYYLLYGGEDAHLNETITLTMQPPKPNGAPLAWAQSNYSRLLAANGSSLLDWMAERCWTSLQEKDRASNRRAADHAWIKLRMLGLQTKEADSSTGFNVGLYLEEYQQILDHHREKLAQLEHRRWSAEKMLEGYTPLLDELPGRRDEVKQMEWKGDKKETWRMQKLHLDLDLFENLSPTEQQKDYDQFLGLPYMLLAIGLRITGKL